MDIPRTKMETAERRGDDFIQLTRSIFYPYPFSTSGLTRGPIRGRRRKNRVRERSAHDL